MDSLKLRMKEMNVDKDILDRTSSVSTKDRELGRYLSQTSHESAGNCFFTKDRGLGRYLSQTLHRVANFLEFLELFWNFFCTGNVLEKSHFFRLVLELFFNSEFLMSDFLGYNISGCPLFGSPICEKILPHFGRPCILEKCENVLEMFGNCYRIF